MGSADRGLFEAPPPHADALKPGWRVQRGSALTHSFTRSLAHLYSFAYMLRNIGREGFLRNTELCITLQPAGGVSGERGYWVMAGSHAPFPTLTVNPPGPPVKPRSPGRSHR